MKTIPDYLRTWFANQLDLSIAFTNASYDVNDDLTTFEVEELLHLREQMTVTLTGVGSAKVQSVDRANNEFTVSGNFSLATGIIIEGLFFINGTPLNVNREILSADPEVKFPMVYLYEQLKESVGDATSAIRSADLRLFLLDASNKDWATLEHYEERIRGLYELAYRIINQLRSDRQIHTDETDFDLIYHANFGVFATDKGHTKQILTDNVSGVEMQFTLNIKNC